MIHNGSIFNKKERKKIDFRKFREDVTLGLKAPLEPPLMNGGGCIKTVEGVREAARSPMGAVLIGSFTLLPRDGNSGNIFWVGQHGALNALGMPNRGLPYLGEHLKEMVTICHDAGKPLIVNIAGFSPNEYVELATVCTKNDVDAVELNLGCPNVVTPDGSRKPIPSYNPEVFEQIVTEVGACMPPNFPLWVKVSPNLIGEQIPQLAQIVARQTTIKAVTAINTVPNCYGVDDKGNSHINIGLAGLSGAVIKPIGLGQVWQWRRALPKRVSVIGVGGITVCMDVRDYENAGASACQITTQALRGGKMNFKIFEQIIMKYITLPQ